MMVTCSVWLKLRLLNNMTTFQTLQTWIGHNAMPSSNLNELPHALSYIFSEICLLLGYLQRVTTRFHHFFKKSFIIIFTFINLMVTCCNSSQISPKPYWTDSKCRVMCMVTHCIMAYSYIESLLMGDNMFKHNWNGFC